MNDSISIDIYETLSFFDEKPTGSSGHATSIVGICGEDLAAGSFAHYIQATALVQLNRCCKCQNIHKIAGQ
ncbi:hypothetical protein [Desulfosarcina ovata]|uniref:Uncharacterized protein n=1 Tax=Desulfosarcina ovata subsp. ovata TaxID=2752305 RepID=A0A5K8A4D0_9BACT|nr:hypothetical protein [Desulfosarcina ovata]BBO87150.1 hypothetical protein DSCOOX_03300 [Desulfosarcina ovata subsp. ovata]